MIQKTLRESVQVFGDSLIQFMEELTDKMDCLFWKTVQLQDDVETNSYEITELMKNGNKTKEINTETKNND